MYGNFFLHFLWNNIFQIILLMRFNHFFYLGLRTFRLQSQCFVTCTLDAESDMSVFVVSLNFPVPLQLCHDPTENC